MLIMNMQKLSDSLVQSRESVSMKIYENSWKWMSTNPSLNVWNDILQNFMNFPSSLSTFDDARNRILNRPNF